MLGRTPSYGNLLHMDFVFEFFLISTVQLFLAQRFEHFKIQPNVILFHSFVLKNYFMYFKHFRKEAFH